MRTALTSVRAVGEQGCSQVWGPGDGPGLGSVATSVTYRLLSRTPTHLFLASAPSPHTLPFSCSPEPPACSEPSPT